MTKYTVASRRGARTEEKQVDPIWRGIGCFMFIIIPVISFVLGRWTVNTAVERGLPVPFELIGYPILPPALTQSALAPVAFFIQAQQNLYGILLMTLIYIVVIGGIISVIYAYVYRVVGPPRYGPLDAEQPRVAVKRYKR